MPANTRHSRSRDDVMPYRYDDACLDFGIEGFSFDGGESGNPDYDERSLPLHEYGEWDEVTIEGSVSVGDSVDNLFPNNEGPPFPAKLTVVVDAEETQFRQEVVVNAAPTESDSYDVKISLRRELLRGSVVMTPRLVRSEPCRTGLPYAPNEGMRVAGGQSWELEVDAPEKDHEGFPFVYRDFSQGGMPPEELAHSFSKNPNPKMMINTQNQGVVDVLQTGGTYGFRPNFKRLLKADFGSMLWIQLVLLTATTVAEAGEPEFDWQEGVVEEMAQSELGTYLFGSGVDYETIVGQIGDRVDDPTEMRDFVTDLCEAVQLYTEYADHLDYFVDEEAP